jgi:hypothetical protein
LRSSEDGSREVAAGIKEFEVVRLKTIHEDV